MSRAAGTAMPPPAWASKPPPAFTSDPSKFPLGQAHDPKTKTHTYRSKEGVWAEWTYNDQGNIVLFRNSSGFWSEWTYDSRGRVATFRSSDGRWGEWERDEAGKVLAHRSGRVSAPKAELGERSVAVSDDSDEMIVPSPSGP